MKNVIAEREKYQAETKNSPVIAFAVTGDSGAIDVSKEQLGRSDKYFVVG